MDTVAEGSLVADFTLATDQGDIALAALRGRPVVLYFYPKDDTSGCTKEALSFTCLKDAFDKRGAMVIGVSPDSLERHAKFRAKHALTIPLAADENHALAEAFGVWVEKSMYGRTYMGIERSTFLIGPDGRVRKLWRKVKVAGHAEAVLAAVTEL